MKRTCISATCLLFALLAHGPTAEAQLNIGAYGAYPQPYSPNCVAPLVWTLTNGHYSCQNPPPPPPPSCPGGSTEMTAPSWNGSAWVGMVCVPIASKPPPPPATPVDDCIQRAANAGYSVDGSTNKVSTKQGGNTVIQLWPVYGHYYEDVSVYTNQYEYGCFYNSAGTHISTDYVYDYWMFHSG